MSKSKKWSANEKINIVFDSLRGDKTIQEIALKNGLHPRQILRWKDKIFEEAEKIFLDKRTQQSDPDKDQLLCVIDQLTSELEFIKKKLKRNN